MRLDWWVLPGLVLWARRCVGRPCVCFILLLNDCSCATERGLFESRLMVGDVGETAVKLSFEPSLLSPLSGAKATGPGLSSWSAPQSAPDNPRPVNGQLSQTPPSPPTPPQSIRVAVGGASVC